LGTSTHENRLSLCIAMSFGTYFSTTGVWCTYVRTQTCRTPPPTAVPQMTSTVR